MMLAAPIFLEMSKTGQLGCDVWLVHLTGEEFPADCLGARHLTPAARRRHTCSCTCPAARRRDLSQGAASRASTFSDMIAHNNDHDRDVFQIAPGTRPHSLWLAEQAHLANEIWNESVPVWNRKPPSGRPGRAAAAVRTAAAIPEIGPVSCPHGQVRPRHATRAARSTTPTARSSPTPACPVVLFMENYDINRTGYHDTHDTMENIDLDYGAAVCRDHHRIGRAEQPQSSEVKHRSAIEVSNWQSARFVSYPKSVRQSSS